MPASIVDSNWAIWVHNNNCPKVLSETSRRAIDKAQKHAQVPRNGRVGEDIGFDKLNKSSRGQNTNELKKSGVTKLGRRKKNTNQEYIDHPGGHPDLTGPNHPPHHSSPHVHSTNKKGEKTIITYPPKEKK